MLRDLAIKLAACCCLWKPCRCEEIERMHPNARVADQDRIARDYLAKTEAAAARRHRDAVQDARVAARIGMDGQTAEQRTRARTTSQIVSPVGFQLPNHPIQQAWQDMPCTQCGVKDDRVHTLSVLGLRVPLHEGNCSSLYRLAQKSQPGY